MLTSPASPGLRVVLAHASGRGRRYEFVAFVATERARLISRESRK